MNDVYVEYSFKIKAPLYKKIIVLIGIVCSCILLFYSIYFPILSTIGIFFLVMSYFINKSCKLEYEYILINDELTIYKIINNASRKKVYTIDLNYIDCIMDYSNNDISYNHKKIEKIKQFFEKDNKDPIIKIIISHGNHNQCIFINSNQELLDGLKKRCPLKVKIAR